MSENYEAPASPDGPDFRDHTDIAAIELSTALRSLYLIDADPYLRMQALNVAIIDKFILSLEGEALEYFHREDRWPVEMVFLSAQTQMWIFATFELLRTWNERNNKVLRLVANNGKGTGFDDRIASLERERGFPEIGRRMQAETLKRVATDRALQAKIDEDRRQIHTLLSRMKLLRVTLAKHQYAGHPTSVATAPGVGRPDIWTGSLSYELEKEGFSIGEMSRRAIGDAIRALPDRSHVPTTAEIEEFDTLMKFKLKGSPFDAGPAG